MIDRGPNTGRSISFSPTQHEGLRLLATDIGESRSVIIQRLLVAELTRFYGDNWEQMMHERIARRERHEEAA